MGASRAAAPAAIASLLLVVACKDATPATARSIDAAPSRALTADAAPADAGPGVDLEGAIAEAKRGSGAVVGGRRWGPPAGLDRDEVELLEGEDESVNVEGIIDSFFWAGVERCYDQALAKQAGLHGRVVVTFTIGKNGRISRSEVKGFDAGLDACIAARVKKWHFPIKHGPKRYRAPFDLNKNPQPPPVY